MTINFKDPAQTTHEGQPIPINTEVKYAAGEAILKSLYAFYGVPWTSESAAAYEQRVRNGQTLREIIANTYDEYLERTAEVAPRE